MILDLLRDFSKFLIKDFSKFLVQVQWPLTIGILVWFFRREARSILAVFIDKMGQATEVKLGNIEWKIGGLVSDDVMRLPESLASAENLASQHVKSFIQIPKGSYIATENRLLSGEIAEYRFDASIVVKLIVLDHKQARTFYKSGKIFTAKHVSSGKQINYQFVAPYKDTWHFVIVNPSQEQDAEIRF